MSTANEYQLGNDIYVFATSAVAGAFGACLMNNSLDKCKADFPPVSVRILSDEIKPAE